MTTSDMSLLPRLIWSCTVKKNCRAGAVLFFVAGMCFVLQNREHSKRAGTTEGVISLRAPQYTDAESVPDSYSHIRKGDLSWLRTAEDFFRRLETENSQSNCRKLLKMGGDSCRGIVDGAKWVCLDEDVIFKPPNCTVYSFGLDLEISFDNEVAWYGCDVYMMDPTLPPDTYSGLEGKQKFFPVGLSDSNLVYPFNLTFLNWQGIVNMKVASFDSVKTFINHTGAVHYLKMDIEGSEWRSLQYMMDHNLLGGVQQIMVELHSQGIAVLEQHQAVAEMRRKWQFLEQLESHGFLRVKYEPTMSLDAVYRIPHSNRTLQTCGELFLLRRYWN
uniref:Methyltransferase-like protein 24 isoform X2 n=1 Tax=Hirondellea gigas TaxID=1518452 RepID=A0A6A7G4D4_9CRUS